MAKKPFLNLFLFCFLLAAPHAGAVSFTSTDGAFSIDMPSGWTAPAKLPERGVLSLQKGTARIDIKTIACTTETCIEKKVNTDLVDVKRKKMQVVGNSYTEEEIKRIEFSTGEPFFYISFFTPKNDFSAGYFLINEKAYSILAKDLSYAEADLIFSFISPTAPQKPSIEIATEDKRAYNIAAMPDVEEEELSAPQIIEAPAAQAASSAPQQVAPISEKPQISTAKKDWRAWLRPLKKRFKELHINTLVSPHMPPYIRQLGPAFDVIIVLLLLYVLIQSLGLVAHWIFYRATVAQPANPNSLYPIRFARLYGTPSLIFRAKDNQGNTLIALSSRWDSLFLWSGSLLVVFTLLTLGGAGLCEALHLWPKASFAYNTLYSVCSLLLPLGIAIFCCGVVWSQLILSEISLFDRKENKAALLVQKGFAVTKETYEIYFARSKDKLIAVRRRFCLRRTWKILSKDGQEIAQITEKSFVRSILRKLTGHLWGFFRADYQISGQMDSQGTIQNDHAAFNRFTCNLDKPEAINARDMLAVSLLINIRDRDKWYPWIN